MDFPTWLYHRSEPAVIVHDEESAARLGPEWADTPAAFLDDCDLPDMGTAPSSAATEPAAEKKPKRKRATE